MEAGETRERHVPKNFKPTNVPAHKEMLRVLREEEEGTVTIVAVGPLANLALAAEEDVCPSTTRGYVVCGMTAVLMGMNSM